MTEKESRPLPPALTLIPTPVTRWKRGEEKRSDTDSLAREEPLAIQLDGRTLTITMRTPGHDRELATGFLASEGIIRSAGEIAFEEETNPNFVEIAMQGGREIDFTKLTRHVFASSSCGLCGKTSIDRVRLPFDPVRPGPVIDAEALLRLPARLREAQAVFAQTGGLHAAGAFDISGRCLVAREDIGRHNAVDKVVGHGLLNGQLPFSESILMVSGRTSFEIMQKALAGGFPIVAAVSAPSSLAVEFARESRQTLIGFLREDRFNVYTHPERVKN